jgi:dethiobiotin synthetase
MKQSKRYFVTGIDTNVGKTVAAAIVTQALQADYWKPVQAGDLEQSDSLKVKHWLSNPQSKIHPEAYRLHTPASPHYAAERDGIRLEAEQLKLPQTDNHLVVEGAGGLFVPLNERYLMIDLIKDLQLPVLLVVNFYLGSINHTLASIDALQRRSIPITGLLFNGNITPSSKTYILEYSKVPCLAEFPQLDALTPATIAEQADLLRPRLLFQQLSKNKN